MAQALAFTAIASVVQAGISYMFPSEGPRLKDIKISASTYGNIIPEGFGQSRVAGNMIWSSPVRETKQKKQAGKGGGYYNQYTYDVDFAMAFAQGPIDEIRRIWADGKLIYDATGTSVVDTTGKFTMRAYMGTDDQLPDPVMEEWLGVGETPAHRGLAYVVFDNFQLADFGNRIPQMAAEIYRGDSGDFSQIPATLLPQGSPSQGNIVVDFDAGYYYTSGGWEGGYGFRKFAIDGHREVQRISHPTFGGAMALTSRGYIVTQSGAADNFQRISVLNPAGVVTGGFGTDSGIGTDPDTFPEDVSASFTPSHTCLDANGREFYLHMGFRGHLTWFQITPTGGLIRVAGVDGWNGGDAPQWTVDNGNGSDAYTHQAWDVCPWPGNGTFFIVHGSTYYGDGIARITVVNSNGKHEAFSFALGSDMNDETGSCFFDGTGVVFFYTSNKVHHIAKYDPVAGVLVWDREMPGVVSTPDLSAARVNDGRFAFLDLGEKVYQINTLNGEWINPDSRKADLYYDETEIEYAEAVAEAQDGPQPWMVEGSTPKGYQIFDSGRNAIIATESGAQSLIPLAGGAYATSLGFIVESLLRKSGLRGGQFDVTALYGIEVPGYAWAATTDLKSILSELRTVYLFDLVESNGIIRARLRGGQTPDEVIDSRILGSTSEDRADFWRETRTAEAELPAKLTLVYTNIDDDFEQSTAFAKRTASPIPTMFSRQTANLESNLVLYADDAKTRVYRMMFAQWGERNKHEAILPWAYAYLEPSDLIEVNFPDGRSYFERIHYTELGANFNLEFECYSQDTGAYTITKTGDGGGSGRTQVVTPPTAATVFVLNTPLLRDVDATQGSTSRFYTAVGGVGGSPFTGATVYVSADNEDYELLYSESNEAEWGYVMDTVPSPSHGPFALDWETRIRIAPQSKTFELEGATLTQMTQGANLCVIGDEVLQFMDCEQTSDGAWVIWNLYRGRRGTEWACDHHQPGERFMFLDLNTVEPNAEPLDAIGSQRWFKAVGDGKSLNGALTESINYQPRDLMPYAPTNIHREDQGAAGFKLTWKRRTRLGGGLLNGTDAVPLNEAAEKYEVYLLENAFAGDPSTGAPPASYMRKIETTSPEAIYSLDDMASDGFAANLDTLHVVVYQVSAVVGRGFPGFRSIEPWRID